MTWLISTGLSEPRLITLQVWEQNNVELLGSVQIITRAFQDLGLPVLYIWAGIPY